MDKGYQTISTNLTLTISLHLSGLNEVLSSQHTYISSVLALVNPFTKMFYEIVQFV